MLTIYFSICFTFLIYLGKTNGACDPWRWGSNCVNSCGLCFNFDCNESNGVCRQGCWPGFKGSKCTEPCPASTYGYKCLLKCGECASNTCVTANGVCQGGCKAGWYGRRCDIPKPSP